jgi:hypothetical protein
MYYLVNMDRNTWQRISLKVALKGFNKCCISSAVDGTDNDMLWNDSKEDRNVRSECEEDEGTDCDSDWLVKVYKIWYALCMQWIVKYFS